MADDTLTLVKFCRKGKMRRPEFHAEAVAAGPAVRMPSKIGYRSYELAMADHDPADTDLYTTSFIQFMKDTREFRRLRKQRAMQHRGKAHCYKAQWLMDNKGFDGDGCLFFPSMITGRPERVKYNYRNMAAARAMLLMTEGLPVGEADVATHKCGNGHLSCVNPKHLMWGTAGSNARDRVVHNSPREFVSGMSEAVVAEIYNDPRLVKVLAWEHDIPASVVSGIKSGELWTGWTTA